MTPRSRAEPSHSSSQVFFSEKLDSPIKVSFKIDTFEEFIVIGHMDVANKKEEKKLNKEIKSKDIDSRDVYNNDTIDLNKTESLNIKKVD